MVCSVYLYTFPSFIKYMFLICKYDLLPILIFFNLKLLRNHIIMQLSLAMYFVSQAPATLHVL